MMDEKKPAQTPERTPATAQAVPSAPAYAIDGKERLLLPLAWAIGVLFVELFFVWFWAWGLVVPILVGTWYAVLLWYRGLDGFAKRESLLLFGAACLLALTYPLFSNPWFRMWNALALPALITVQLYSWAGAAYPWTSPIMLLERFSLLFKGLFSWGSVAQTILSFKNTSRRRPVYVLGALAVSIPLLLLSASLLGNADALFRYVSAGAVSWLTEHLWGWVLRLLLGLCFMPLLFSLLYTLRHPKVPCAKTAHHAITLDPAAPATVMLAMDALYLFFLAVQSAALFGGEPYLARAGISYADYARSGFFQLVAVAAINLTLVLICLQLCKREGRAWRSAQILASVLVAESVILLISAAWRMSLYVAAYGLTFKRFLTYWGMVMLALFFAAAFFKIWRKQFSFFKVLFAASVTGWLILNFINVDYLVSRYNVDHYLDGRGAVVDLYYLTHLSFGALGPLGELPNDAPAGTQTLGRLMEGRRSDAAVEAKDWHTWSLSAQLAMGG